MIFSITTGQGHNQTAKVMAEELGKNGIACKYMDVYEYIHPKLSDSISKLYLMSTKNVPKMYGVGYRIMEMREAGNNHVLPKLTNIVLAKKLLKLIREEKPDFIICTHVFAALLVTYLRERFDEKIHTVGVITDYTIHPFWEDTRLDYYVTASELLEHQGLKKGIAPGKIKAFGIPIDPKFAVKRTKSEACAILGIPEKKTVLVMSGSMGFGKMTDGIHELDKLPFDFQIVTICGNNKKMKEQIDNMEFKKDIYNHGYVNNVDIFMDAADCIVTKPGGLTSSEALAKGLPMIMNNPVPGQEDRNVEFLLNAGAALKISDTFSLSDAIYQLFLNKERLENLKRSIQFIGKPNSTEQLVEFVKGLDS